MYVHSFTWGNVLAPVAVCWRGGFSLLKKRIAGHRATLVTAPGCHKPVKFIRMDEASPIRQHGMFNPTPLEPMNDGRLRDAEGGGEFAR